MARLKFHRDQKLSLPRIFLPPLWHTRAVLSLVIRLFSFIQKIIRGSDPGRLCSSRIDLISFAPYLYNSRVPISFNRRIYVASIYACARWVLARRCFETRNSATASTRHMDRHRTDDPVSTRIQKKQKASLFPLFSYNSHFLSDTCTFLRPRTRLALIFVLSSVGRMFPCIYVEYPPAFDLK